MEKLFYLERSLQLHFKTKEIFVFYSVFFDLFFQEPKHMFRRVTSIPLKHKMIYHGIMFHTLMFLMKNELL